MTPIFDRDAKFVGWVSGDWESIFDPEMRRFGYIDRGNAWQAANGDWVGPVIDGNFNDRSGHPIAWTNTNLRPQGAFKKPLQPLKPLKPLEPKKPHAPAQPEKPLTPVGGWSSMSFRAAFG
jgi:hypothetical protein